jgi:hypothetical protein
MKLLCEQLRHSRAVSLRPLSLGPRTRATRTLIAPSAEIPPPPWRSVAQQLGPPLVASAVIAQDNGRRTMCRKRAAKNQKELACEVRRAETIDPSKWKARRM